MVVFGKKRIVSSSLPGPKKADSHYCHQSICVLYDFFAFVAVSIQHIRDGCQCSILLAQRTQRSRKERNGQSLSKVHGIFTADFSIFYILLTPHDSRFTFPTYNSKPKNKPELPLTKRFMTKIIGLSNLALSKIVNHKPDLCI